MVLFHHSGPPRMDALLGWVGGQNEAAVKLNMWKRKQKLVPSDVPEHPVLFRVQYISPSYCGLLLCAVKVTPISWKIALVALGIYAASP